MSLNEKIRKTKNIWIKESDNKKIEKRIAYLNDGVTDNLCYLALEIYTSLAIICSIIFYSTKLHYIFFDFLTNIFGVQNFAWFFEIGLFCLFLLYFLNIIFLTFFMKKYEKIKKPSDYDDTISVASSLSLKEYFLYGGFRNILLLAFLFVLSVIFPFFIVLFFGESKKYYKQNILIWSILMIRKFFPLIIFLVFYLKLLSVNYFSYEISNKFFNTIKQTVITDTFGFDINILILFIFLFEMFTFMKCIFMHSYLYHYSNNVFRENNSVYSVWCIIASLALASTFSFEIWVALATIFIGLLPFLHGKTDLKEINKIHRKNLDESFSKPWFLYYRNKTNNIDSIFKWLLVLFSLTLISAILFSGYNIAKKNNSEKIYKIYFNENNFNKINTIIFKKTDKDIDNKIISENFTQVPNQCKQEPCYFSMAIKNNFSKEAFLEHNISNFVIDKNQTNDLIEQIKSFRENKSLFIKTVNSVKNKKITNNRYILMKNLCSTNKNCDEIILIHNGYEFLIRTEKLKDSNEEKYFIALNTPVMEIEIFSYPVLFLQKNNQEKNTESKNAKYAKSVKDYKIYIKPENFAILKKEIEEMSKKYEENFVLNQEKKEKEEK